MFRALITIGVLLAAVPGAGQSGRPVESVDARFDEESGKGDLLLVPVLVNRKRFSCVADTGGSSVFSLDDSKAAAAGFQSNASGSSSGVGPNVVQDRRMTGATLQIGDIVLRDRTVVLRPFPPEMPEMDCVLGTALLRDYVVEFDYTEPALRLYRPADFRPSSRAVAVPFRLERDNPVADAALTFANGSQTTASVVLDTGASYYAAALMPPFVSGKKVLEQIAATARRPERPKGAGGEVRVTSTRVGRLTLGQAYMEQPIIGLLETESAGFAWDGLLGAGFFRQFTAAFDYTRSQVYLEPNRSYGRRQVFDASGVAFLRDPETRRFQVDVVLPDSPAAKAGLKPGDTLVSMEGKETARLTMRSIIDMLSEPGRSRHLWIRREGVLHEIYLKLQDRLPDLGAATGRKP